MTQTMQRLVQDRILRRPVVEDITGLSRTAIYAGMANGTFPKNLKITGKAVGWRESDIAAWLASRQPAAA
jgi:prophage regulatory protein